MLKRASAKRLLLALAITASVLLPGAAAIAGTARIKDIVDIEGIRENQLVGYGLVVGLNGSGDSLNNSPFTKQSLQAMLERMGVNTRGEALRTANVAAVMVTANLAAFFRPGQPPRRYRSPRSAMPPACRAARCSSPRCSAADGEVYAIAQGPVSINGFKAQGDAATVVSGVPTTGRISSGALIEREIDFDLGKPAHAPPVAAQSRPHHGPPHRARHQRFHRRLCGRARKPHDHPADPAEKLQRQHRRPSDRCRATGRPDGSVRQDRHRRELGHHRHGQGCACVDGRRCPVEPHRHHRRNRPRSVQPNPLSGGQTAAVPRSNVQVNSQSSSLALVPESVTLQELVDGLNTLGISPRDLIAILQAIKAAGALQAEIEVM